MIDWKQIKDEAQGKSLLIVDDDPQTLQTLERLLSHFFSPIYTASNFADAVRLFEEKSANDEVMLLITDINLGTQSGVELICKIKHTNPNQKIIAISGTQDRSVFVETIRCGVDRFILKPIEENELLSALSIVLSKMSDEEELKENRRLLIESREYALRLLEEQDRFLKNAIHEIHTPLAIIITNIDLLRMGGIDDESLDAIEAGSRIIQNSYEDMTYLMKRDRIPDAIELIDVVEFIRERVSYFNCIALANELTLSIRVGQLVIPKILFSTLKLSRMVDNTLSNAIKYSYRGTDVAIVVGMRKGDVFFEVHNQGPLIKNKKKIFERYHRETQTKGGFGLGLSIVASICAEDGIGVDITSSSRGNKFRYSFPHATFFPSKEMIISPSSQENDQ
jgi:two-component system sensor histidine kinase/response regulator